jgi:hypothetical protein
VFDGLERSASVNRHVATWVVLLQGLGMGLLAFGIAELSLPHSTLNSTSHDMMLAQRLGLLYTPAAGAWLGWLQRSRNRALAGAAVGLGIGAIYFVLCMGQNFLAIMVGFPMLLGAGLAALVGSNRSAGVGGLLGRLAKGLIAGLVLGYVYMFLLNAILDTFIPPQRLFDTYVYEMWKGGLPAMGVASALFFVLLRWAVGLVRLSFEEA